MARVADSKERSDTTDLSKTALEVFGESLRGTLTETDGAVQEGFRVEERWLQAEICLEGICVGHIRLKLLQKASELLYTTRHCFLFLYGKVSALSVCVPCRVSARQYARPTLSHFSSAATVFWYSAC